MVGFDKLAGKFFWFLLIMVSGIRGARSLRSRLAAAQERRVLVADNVHAEGS